VPRKTLIWENMQSHPALNMPMLGRTEADREITSEPWSSMHNSKDLKRPLAGVKGEACSKSA
jgi:hypothetical protein